MSMNYPQTAAVVVADFYQEIAAALLESCRRTCAAAQIACDVHYVRGALEIPAAIDRLAAAHPYHCFVALGCVIRGETYHFEVVANASASGILQVQLQRQIAIGNGILTVENTAQAQARYDKGAAAAAAALALAKIGN
ncbi:MAG: 6,7-dimethyl-8-ribityllumazine synthase [Proteobacteria bacterium]|nr:6,7-dimethyl-8-ribityllumazine synthase [Pseudomonadota bacterium]